MRKPSPRALVRSAHGFVRAVGALPVWVDEFAAAESGRGHYEWGAWAGALRAPLMWAFGGPWRVLVADVRLHGLLRSVDGLHRVKEQLVWEVVRKVYADAEAARGSSAPREQLRKRVQSVYSKQCKHLDGRHSLAGFLDFAFVLVAHDAFVVDRRFLDTTHPDPASRAPALRPAALVAYARELEGRMLAAGFLPFYARAAGVPDRVTLRLRQAALTFCAGLPPPALTFLPELHSTRGMQQLEKLGDCTSPWLARLKSPACASRWRALTDTLLAAREAVEGRAAWELVLRETSRAVTATALTRSAPQDGVRDDVLPLLACSMAELSPLFRVPVDGARRWERKRRPSFRSVLEMKLTDWERLHGARGLSRDYMDEFERAQARRKRNRTSR